MKMQIGKKLMFGCAAMALLVSCGPASPSKPVLATSFYPLYFLASEIAGEDYEVINLTPAGTEPHDVEITPSMRRAMEDASVLFLNGLGLETWSEELTPSLQKKTVLSSEGIETMQIDGRTDPHVWLDLGNLSKMSENMYDALCSVDPARKEAFQTNYLALKARIETAIGKYQAMAESFPEGKVIAVNHAAFGYLCAEWGIEQVYINNLSPNEEPSASAIASIIDTVKQRGIDTIFFEELASDEVARFIAEKTGAKCLELNPLEGLTQEDLDAGLDFLDIYDENMTKIQEARP